MRLYAARVWLNTYVNRTPAAVIPASKYPMIHNAVLDKCDALDGVKDGVIEDPTQVLLRLRDVDVQRRGPG